MRQVGNRLAGILHGCLESGTCYDEHTAWGTATASLSQPPPDLLTPIPRPRRLQLPNPAGAQPESRPAAGRPAPAYRGTQGMRRIGAENAR